MLNGTKLSDAVVKLSPFDGSLSQQWIVHDKQWFWAGNPSYCLVPDWKSHTLKLEDVSICKTYWNFSDQGILETNLNVLDVPWESPRTRVIVYPKHGGENQRWWRLSEVKSLVQNKAARANYPKALLEIVSKMPQNDDSCQHHCQGKPQEKLR